MNQSVIQRWLDAWGYKTSSDGLHSRSTSTPATYAYRTELEELLDPDRIIQATAVFDVDGVPTVCFIEDDGRLAEDPVALDRIREKIWNQNLISIVLVVSENEVLAVPVNQREYKSDKMELSKAHETGPYSCRDMQSGDIFHRHTDWFTPEARVDQDLLRNLYRIVQDLETFGFKKVDAQYLMAQVLFVSYLEHREIIGETYRKKHNLKHFEELIIKKNRTGITRLLRQLKRDFNGDFLEPETKGSALWKMLSDKALGRLAEFLGRVDLDSGQQDLWNYDFRYIPVELISGIYESFLSDEKRKIGAYYTPRHLANLVVDQVFSDSNNILTERIYDGACGSGILLTTAYRRMLAYAEFKNQRPLEFEERRRLLEEHIFGSDLNESACRVTAFSLYLSMLEGLQPADIADLQENNNVKLPSLSKNNLKGGSVVGDFFSSKNRFAESRSFTILLSNPPWVEPSKNEILESDRWAKQENLKIPRRQTAGAFMLRAEASLVPNGRICLILPISILAAPTSTSFVRTWLERYQLSRLINFGDLRKLLFSTAKQPCVVAMGMPRKKQLIGNIPGAEKFEYWVPKADISFAFNRLTLHSSDRHIIQSKNLSISNEILTSLYWGTARDVATIAGLRLLGELDDVIGKNGPWNTRKGFHKHDTSIDDPVSSKLLHKKPYLDAKQLVVDGPIFDHNLLVKFPDNIETVARLPDDLLEAFNGPKIVFTDGMTNQRGIRAAFTNKAFSFCSSIGVISGPKKDESLLKFVAAYLHSSLVQYVILLTAYQVNFERERITLKDIRKLAFIHPDHHHDKDRAWQIVHEIASKMTKLARKNALLHQPYDGHECDTLILEYFGLTRLQQARVREVVNDIAPNLQPSSVLGLDTMLQRRPNMAHVEGYMRALRAEFKVWLTARGGKGSVSVSVSVNSTDTCGALGIVRVEPMTDPKNTKGIGTTINDKVVVQLLQQFEQFELLPLEVSRNLYLAADTVIRVGESIYLIKALNYRLWLRSEAYRDVERIVQHITSTRSDMVSA